MATAHPIKQTVVLETVGRVLRLYTSVILCPNFPMLSSRFLFLDFFVHHHLLFSSLTTRHCHRRTTARVVLLRLF